jgi:microcystin-dependent protein
MGQPYIGEIRMFAGSFAPVGWMTCSGQIMPISENDALFTLIGTTYGGDGQETFGLPDLQGRLPNHAGQGPGLSNNYQLGEKAGVEGVTLSTNQIPNHNHMVAGTATAQQNSPQDAVFATITSTQAGVFGYETNAAPSTSLIPATIQGAGGSQPHDNIQPTLCINYIISLFGVFPTQN